MKNFEWCAYTYRHRKMIQYLVEKLVRDEAVKEEMLRHAENHDMDKILLYQVMEQEEAQHYHVEHQPHHPDCKKEKTIYDLIETVLDYESAPYTKPDKPMNAFDFTHFLLDHHYLSSADAEILFQIMHDLGIDHSGTVQNDSEGLAYAQSLSVVTEEMILEDVEAYMKRIH